MVGAAKPAGDRLHGKPRFRAGAKLCAAWANLAFRRDGLHSRTMSHDPNAAFDHSVLDMIEHSPTGAVPVTPAYQDALNRLYASHQVYAHADHKGGHVTARSLAKSPVFHANNLRALTAGQIGPEALEPNAGIFDRYLQSLPPALRPKAESFRLLIAGRPAHHRAKLIGNVKHVAHDPIHTLFLVPGTGPHPGVPGNYLYGWLLQTSIDSGSPWMIHLHDSDDGAAMFDAPTLPEALSKLEELFESAPFTTNELQALGFRLN
jgi:hypothetical protein